MCLSKHAKKRMKERVGLPKRVHTSLMELSHQFGITHNDVKGEAGNYLRDIHKRYDAGAIPYVFRNNIYVFDDRSDILITIYPFPAKYQRLISRIWKSKYGESYKRYNNIIKG